MDRRPSAANSVLGPGGGTGRWAATTSHWTPRSCAAISSADWKRSAGSSRGGALEEAVERVVGCIREADVLRRRQLVEVAAPISTEVSAQDNQRARHGEQVGDDRRPPRLGDLGGLVASCPVDRARPGHAVHTAEVDQLQPARGRDDVRRLEVAVQQADVVKVCDGREDLEDVFDRQLDRQRIGLVAVGLPPRAELLAEAPAVHPLHHDVAVTVMFDEVVDLDDVGVLDLGEGLPLGQCGGHGRRVAAVDQTLESHPAVVDPTVAGHVDPSEAAVVGGAGYLILAGDQLAPPQLGRERERMTTLAAEPLREARDVIAAAANRPAAPGTEPAMLGDVRVRHDGCLGIPDQHRRYRHQARSEAAPSRGGGAAAWGSSGVRGWVERRDRLGAEYLGVRRERRCGRQPALVARTVVDLAGAPRPGAPHGSTLYFGCGGSAGSMDRASSHLRWSACHVPSATSSSSTAFTKRTNSGWSRCMAIP